MKKQIQKKLGEIGYSDKAINKILEWYDSKIDTPTHKKSESKKTSLRLSIKKENKKKERIPKTNVDD
jgi:uncharacterized protein Smg (DUF494 family)